MIIINKTCKLLPIDNKCVYYKFNGDCSYSILLLPVDVWSVLTISICRIVFIRSVSPSLVNSLIGQVQ